MRPANRTARSVPRCPSYPEAAGTGGDPTSGHFTGTFADGSPPVVTDHPTRCVMPVPTDPVRYFTAKQARYIHARAGGACEACGRPLLDGWHAHHVVPHAAGGRTVVWNGRALCPSCHEDLHMSDGFRPRKWQEECFREFEAATTVDGKSLFVLEACPGAGKSAMAAWMAEAVLRDERFQDRYRIDHVIAVVPWASIQGAVNGPGGPTGMCRAFMARGLKTRDKVLVTSSRSMQPVPRAFDVSVTTYQSVINPELLESIRLWRRDAGEWRFALILDEVHHTRASGGAWGDAIGVLRDQAALTVVMSGTYFRSDGHPIQFLRYEHGQPVANYRYSYPRGICDRCVRPVAFRRYDATFNIYDADLQEDVRRDVSLSSVVNKEQLAAAQREVLAPASACVREMVREAHADLTRTRQRFPDAACLFVCRPGTDDGGEDRNVEAVAAVVQEMTGESPVVLTHHDKEDVTAAKLADFRAGRAPYLVAVNMVSEGCDIPRLRSVVFCRYTESEMLFRQIVGRALRMQPGDDDTAATVYLPAFPLMSVFARNIEGDCLQAMREPAATVPPERVDPPADRTLFPAPRLLATNLSTEAAGGVIGGGDVGENYIAVAERLITSEPGFLHSNKVQVGRAMQFFHSQTGTAEPPPPDRTRPPDRERAIVRINLAVKRLGAGRYSQHGDKGYAVAWAEEFHKPFGATWAEAKAQWSDERLWSVAEQLEKRYATEARRAS